jgi:hypothetical protein
MHFGIVLIREKKRSNGDDAWYPCIGNPLDFLDEFTARNLGGADSLLGICCDWRVLIGVVERISQKHDVRGMKRPESLRLGLAYAKDGTQRAHTGFISASRSPTAAAALLSDVAAGRPSMSTTMTNLTPVLVSQPYMASLSSTAWRSPKSWSAVL